MNPQDLSSDIISTLPPSIIETILCFVPIEEAARTSVLSKEWRYKWTKIPKLVFDDYMFKEEPTNDENQVSVSDQTMVSERKRMGERCKLFYAISQVLLMRQGPIHEFALYMKADKTCLEIDHIIRYLSRNNTVKILKLHFFEEEDAYYSLPASVFSLHHLTELHLSNCDLDIQPKFRGFAKLTKLYLKDVFISMETLQHIVSNNRGLKHFTLINKEKELISDVDSTVIELCKSLPLIEHLHTYGWITGCFVIDSVPQEPTTSLIHLKSIFLEIMSFHSPDELRFLARLIRSSPNLEIIQLMIYPGNADNGIVSVILKAYLDIWLEHLKDFETFCFGNLKGELEFVKFILARSPKLKKVGLRFVNAIDKNTESEMLSFLLRSPPASPVVKVVVTSLFPNARSVQD